MWQLFAVWAFIRIGEYFLGRWNTERPQSEDPRKRYLPRSASFGEVLPVVFGTTAIPAPAYQRGRVIADKDTWTQGQTVLGLCQGPVSAVREVWISGNSSSDTADGAQKVTWERMAASGVTLEPGALDGNLPTPATFLRGSELLIVKDNKLRIVGYNKITAFDGINGFGYLQERAPTADGPWETVPGAFTASGYDGGVYLHPGEMWDVGAPPNWWYRIAQSTGVIYPGTAPKQAVWYPPVGSFLPWVQGSVVTLHDFRTMHYGWNGEPLLNYGGAERDDISLDGVYDVVSCSETELELDHPELVNGNWDLFRGQVPHCNNIGFQSSYWITSRGLYYPGIGHIRADPLNLKLLSTWLQTETTLSPTFVAVVSALLASSGPEGLDADAVDLVAAILGSDYWAANLPITVDGDHGIDGLTQSSARAYLGAAGFTASGMFDRQASANEQIQTVLDAVDCVILDTEQTLKILPLGDDEIPAGDSASGVAYVPATSPVAAFGPGDFLRSSGPALQTVALPTDARVNVVSVEYRDRDAIGAPYRVSLETAYDPADIQDQALLTGGNGRREAAPAVLHFITNGAQARRIAQLRLQRALGVRNGQRFRAKAYHALVDCMDPATLTEPHAGLSGYEVRVSAIEETQDGDLSFETVDWPIGMAASVAYATQPVVTPQPFALDPGTTEVPFIAAVPKYLSGEEYAIWVGGYGLSHNFGGSDVYLSLDGSSYVKAGTISGRSPIGSLINDLPSATGLDGTNNLDVDLSSTFSTLTGTTDAGRNDLESTLCWVDGELVSFKTVAAYDAGAYRWRLSSLRRGAWGSAPGLHAAGARFVRLDGDHVAYVKVPAASFGSPIYVKLVPYSIRGDGRPDLASVPASSATLDLPTVAAPTGTTLAVASTAPAPAANQWRASADELAHARWATVDWTMAGDLHSGFDVVLYTGTDPDDASAYVTPPRTVDANIREAVLAVSAGASPLTVKASVRARYASGVVSEWAAYSSTATIAASTNVAQQALALAGTKTQVSYTAAAPGSPATGDLWFSTDTTTVCPLGTSCAGTKNDDGTQRSPATHRGLYWPHRWNGSAWTDTDRQALIVAAEIAAGAVTVDKLAVNTATASRIVFDNGTVVRIEGIGFGTTSQFVEWVGLRSAVLSVGVVDPSLCSASNAIQYLTTTGNAYFRGTLSVGTITNSGQSSDTSATAQVEVGPFGSNGGVITVAFSLAASGLYIFVDGSSSPATQNYATSYTIVLERSVNGGAYVEVATQTITNASGQTMTTTYDAESHTYEHRANTGTGGSFTYSDTLMSTQSRKYRLRITSQGLGYGTYPTFDQRVSITTQE